MTIFTVWSFGCVMFAVMTLYTPYQFVELKKDVVIAGDRPQLTWHTVPVPTRKYVPLELQETMEWKELAKLFEHCTESSPQRRPEMSLVVQGLGLIKEGKPIGNTLTAVANSLSVEDKIQLLQDEIAKAAKQGQIELVQELVQKIQELKVSQ